MRASCMIITIYSTVARLHTVLYSRDSIVALCGSIVAPCETKCAGCGFISRNLGTYWPKALMVHLYHIYIQWVFSVLISCIHAAKPYLDSEPFSWWFTHKRLPLAGRRDNGAAHRSAGSPNRARSRHLKVRTAYASPTAFGAAISDISPRHWPSPGVYSNFDTSDFLKNHKHWSGHSWKPSILLWDNYVI